jgi:predicted  nucleic acid-binding Zn-ribbon protein
MSPEVTQVLRLQSLDIQIARLREEVASLPRHIAQIEKQLDSHLRRLEVDRSALSGNLKERKKLDGDIQSQQQKIAKLRDQMASAKTNEQYRAFQNEIEFCEKEIRRFEDRTLELMTESEPLDQAVKAAEAALATEKKQVEAEKVEARERTAADQKKVAELEAERTQLTTAISKQAIAAYERIRRRLPVAVAEAVDGVCSACHMTIRPQFMQELKTTGSGIMFCENCKRILYYNPPVALDHEIGAPVR